jgi:hypothetical protein
MRNAVGGSHCLYLSAISRDDPEGTVGPFSVICRPIHSIEPEKLPHNAFSQRLEPCVAVGAIRFGMRALRQFIPRVDKLQSLLSREEIIHESCVAFDVFLKQLRADIEKVNPVQCSRGGVIREWESGWITCIRPFEARFNACSGLGPNPTGSKLLSSCQPMALR